MNNATNLQGDEMIVLTRAEYDQLLADTHDGGLIDAAREEARGKPTMPADLVAASLDGSMHPLTAWRKAVGLTIAALAEASGVRPATISDLENGKLDPRHSTLRAIADALSLDVDDIMP